jgi:hypothetical protein
VELDRGSPEEYLLQRLRDEAHRFAIGRAPRARSREAGVAPDDVLAQRRVAAPAHGLWRQWLGKGERR